MHLVTGEEMRAIDRASIDEMGIPAEILMEHAGRAVADEVMAVAPHGARVAVACGSGNNGGDGYVCARWLRERGYDATVYLVKGRPRAGGEAALHLAIYEKLGGPVVELGESPGSFGSAAVIVDALLGTGLEKDVSGPLAAVIEAINRAPGVRIAVDLPSGMDSDTGRTLGHAVRAHRTVTLGFAKVGLMSHPGCELAGEVRVADIGIPHALGRRSHCSLLGDADMAPLVPRRGMGNHKGSNGHVLICAGSKGRIGAALLATSGALRAGAGLVTLATTSEAAPLAAGRVLEAMVASFDPKPGALAALQSLAAGKRVIVWGPGMPSEPEAGELLREAVTALDASLVLDADALNHLAVDPAVLRGARAPVILTPHPGEAARLLGSDTAAVQGDRVGAARKLAAITGAVVVLKGARSVIAAANGIAAINPTGNPGMGTGGTGDVLAGVIGALLGQGLAPFDAARLGTYAHGRAGDLAAAHGQVGMVAGDLLPELPRVLAKLRTN